MADDAQSIADDSLYIPAHTGSIAPETTANRIQPRQEISAAQELPPLGHTNDPDPEPAAVVPHPVSP